MITLPPAFKEIPHEQIKSLGERAPKQPGQVNQPFEEAVSQEGPLRNSVIGLLRTKFYRDKAKLVAIAAVLKVTPETLPSVPLMRRIVFGPEAE